MSNNPLKKFFATPYSSTIAALDKVNRKTAGVMRMKQRIKDNAQREHEKNCESCKARKAMFGGHGASPLGALAALRETIGATQALIDPTFTPPQADEPTKH